MSNNIDPRNKIWKFSFLMIIIGIGFLMVVVRLINVQILNADDYKHRAEIQHKSRIELSANRGDIVDAFDRPVATTYVAYTVAADPSVVQDPERIANLVFNQTGISKTKLLKKLRKKDDQYVVLAKQLYPNQVSDLKKIKDRGLILIPQPKRLFVYGETLSQIIGLTDNENKGQSGIELTWDKYLKGQSGFIIMSRDGLSRLKPAADLPVSPAKDGNSLELTIDIELQKIVEYELKKGVINSDAASGTVVIIEPQTGRILSMASYPTFNPNSKEGNKPENRRIRAITDSYEPGSTFKMITAATALDIGHLTENTIYNGFKGYHAGNHFRIRDVHPLGMVPFKEAIIHSSNIIFGQVANEIKDNIFYKYIRDFGFGIPVGIDLPGEVSGKVKKPAEFSGVSKRFMGHGYELTVTPLQLTNAYATIANKGKMMKPYLIQKIFDKNGKTIKKFEPELIRNVIADTTAEKVAELFTAVVDSGTGTAARIGGLKIAGKTGTAQQVVDGRYSKQFYTASFAGFFPADNPKIAMAVIIDKPRASIYGGSVAAPIFQKIASRLVSSQNYNINLVNNDYESDSVIAPELTGLSTDEAKIIADFYDLDLEFDNDGMIIAQSPPAGIKISKNSDIYLNVLSDVTVNDNNKPDLTGLTLSKAVSILARKNVIVTVKGKGKVKKQNWSKDKTGKYQCIIYAE